MCKYRVNDDQIATRFLSFAVAADLVVVVNTSLMLVLQPPGVKETVLPSGERSASVDWRNFLFASVLFAGMFGVGGGFIASLALQNVAQTVLPNAILEANTARTSMALERCISISTSRMMYRE